MANKDEIKPWLIADDHYCAIGRVAVSLAAFDAIVTSAIWQIGGIPDDIGACITSQITQVKYKMKALISILRLRGGLDDVIVKLNQLNKPLGEVSAFRNRVLHDGWVHDVSTNTPHRLEITADNKLILEYVPVSSSELLANAEKTASLSVRPGSS